MNTKSKSLLVEFARLGLEAHPDAPGAEAARKLLAWVEAGQTGDWSAVPRKVRVPVAV